MKSPLKYVGGKSWFVSMYNHLVRNTPYTCLVELFAGGASISFARQEKRALLNDMNLGLMSFYEALRAGDFPVEHDVVDKETFVRVRAEYNRLLKTTCPDIADLADDFYFLNKYGFNGLYRVNARGEYNVPWNKQSHVCYPDFEPYSQLLRNWTLLHGDYKNVHFLTTDLVFADPPYDGTFTSYAAGGFAWAEQLALARYLAGVSSPVITTNAATGRILELYKDLGFTVLTAAAPRRVSCNGDRKPALEMVAYRNLAPEP